MSAIGSRMWEQRDEKPERIVEWNDTLYVIRVGVLMTCMKGVYNWGDALDQEREAWVGTPVEILFDDLV